MNKERIELVPDASKCSGCGACMEICPRRAITMQEGQYGCKYPVIDEGTCVRCGKCLQICPWESLENKVVPEGAYAAAGKNSDVVKRSASGGVFATLALNWIRSGGLTAGAVMDCTDNVRVYHVLSAREDGVQRMQGSKYAHSDAWHCYAEISTALRAGKRILFSGTPCQVAAVRRLTGNPTNLTTIDLICHGVPPVRMLNEYVQLLGKRFRGNISGFSFRDKSTGREFCARIDVQRKKKRTYYLRSSVLSFYRHFLTGVFYRENCYSCPYARLERVSDLTIGDYWGIDSGHADDFAAGRMPVRNDWSCVLVNTDKGRRLLDEHGGELDLYHTEVTWIAQGNHQLCHASERPPERVSMLACYEQGGYTAVEDAFVQSFGGKLRYNVRLVKQVLQNKKACKVNRGARG